MYKLKIADHETQWWVNSKKSTPSNLNMEPKEYDVEKGISSSRVPCSGSMFNFERITGITFQYFSTVFKQVSTCLDLMFQKPNEKWKRKNLWNKQICCEILRLLNGTLGTLNNLSVSKPKWNHSSFHEICSNNALSTTNLEVLPPNHWIVQIYGVIWLERSCLPKTHRTWGDMTTIEIAYQMMKYTSTPLESTIHKRVCHTISHQ